MVQQRKGRHRSRIQVLAGLLALSIGNAGGVDDSEGDAPRGRRAPSLVYSIVNLPAEDGAVSFLNEEGQVAFHSHAFGSNGFFDGARVHDIGSLGGDYTLVAGLNNRGMVVGEAVDGRQAGALRAFRWSQGGGMRALPGPDGSAARAVNDRGQVVGVMPGSGASARAVRWEPDGRVVELGRAPWSLSEASALNDAGMAGGFADVRGGRIHATLWGPAGRAIDLGAMGGARGFTLVVNRRGEAAGVSDTAVEGRRQGFFWSPREGRVAIGAEGSSQRLVAALNDRGDVVGNTERAAGSVAYLWSRARGLVLLPAGAGAASEVVDLNNRGDMVGSINRPGSSMRAVRWSGGRMPVDLNPRLHRPPAGLILYAATAINDAGTIVATSNAGLVLLRPGKHGADAPVLGPVLGLPDTVEVGKELSMKLAFVGSAAPQAYTVKADWSDSCPSPPPRVRAGPGGGNVTLRHRFCSPGAHSLTLTVANERRYTTDIRRRVEVKEAGLGQVDPAHTTSQKRKTETK